MSKLFVYGILKRNYPLDLTGYEAKFIGKACIPGAILYGIGPLHEGPYTAEKGSEDFSGVGLRFTPDNKKIAYGEVFEIPDHLWSWLDSIENNGFSYTREKAVTCVTEDWGDEGVGISMQNIEVYQHTYPNMKYEHPIESGVF